VTPTAPSVSRLGVSRFVPHAATAAAGSAAVLAVALRDPHVAGSWGTCPWLLATGTFCPGCGGLRAVHDLANVQLADALSSNAFVVLTVAALSVGWFAWVLGTLRGRRMDMGRFVTPKLAYAVVAALLAFTVLRNTPLGSALAP
jgi:hypothetical protein